MTKRKKSQASCAGFIAGKPTRRTDALEDDDVVRLLAAAVEREGGQRAFARRYGVDRIRINRTLSGKVPVGRAIANGSRNKTDLMVPTRNSLR
jgi:hypothetical protein